jgi:hypothetical protein
MKGLLTILASNLVMLIIGSLYTFNALSPYITTELQKRDATQTLNSVNAIIPFTLLFMNIGIVIGYK